ncbi:glycogen/starch/alpha-glucan phosphorylase [soil metagenome]
MKVKSKVILDYLNPTGKGAGRIGLSKEDIKTSFLEHLFYGIGRLPAVSSSNDLYTALALTIRDRVFSDFVRSTALYAKENAKALVYLSAEYLPGPHLGINMLNLGITEATREAMAELGLDLDEMVEEEVEPGLGNGGLGRLASCYMDGLATLGIPSVAYGIRYEFGIFNQGIRNGWQVEGTDKWLNKGNPWEVSRPEILYEVKFGGKTNHVYNENKISRVVWEPDTVIKGVAYDTPILGFRSNAIIMRLWKAEAVESFDFSAFNVGDYYKAVEEKLNSENISKVLYPNDETITGKELRLKQQFFFVSCSLQDIIRLQEIQGRSLKDLHKKFTIQLNDTHPSIGVAELMRLLIDEHEMEWDEAWAITTKTFAYTNHTLLPEALEKWPISILGRLLPRHMEIIREIDRRFLEYLREDTKFPEEQIVRMSIIEEGDHPAVRMAHLATVGSFKVNGVSALHSDLLKKQVLNDFDALWPQKLVNVTNGISHRRFLALSNPGLSSLISGHIGNEWLKDLDKLKDLIPYAEDENFRKRWMEVKHQNKIALSKFIMEKTGVEVAPTMIFDVLAKRLHEYKRQHLKVLHILSLFLRLKKGDKENISPTAFIFAGKAAPGYVFAKLIIKLITSVGDLVNNDPDVKDMIKVVFLPNFSVKQAQRVYPAADLSEQISLAGKEASGTGNMKFALNGALTVGTLDGANIEIREEVGEENFFLFGLTTEEVHEEKSRGYEPGKIYDQDPELKEILELLVSGDLSNGDKDLFLPVYENLRYQDPYLLLRDFRSYINCQNDIHALWKKKEDWARISIINSANMGKFSSDRSIRDYCRDIWETEAVRVKE